MNRAVVLFCLALIGCGPAAVDRPPVVVLVLDALHAGHLSHLGYARDTTPVIDALAAEGISFTWAFAPAPYTLASIPSLMTGRLPDTHGVTTKADRLHDDETTLAELFGDAGYRTLAVVSSGNGGARTGIDQGFDEFVELFRVEDGRSADIVRRTGEALHMPRADELRPVVSRWLAGHDGRQPLFLYLHMLQPHSPYDPPAPFRELFLDADYDGPFADGGNKALVATVQGTLQADGQDRAAVRALYDANLRWADHNVGLLFDELRQADLYDDAWIVVTSDHGEAFWQHGQWGHNYQLYDEMLRIPLVIKPPLGRGMPPGTTDALASLTDLMPTLCELVGLPEPSGMDGVSLAGCLGGSPLPGERELLLRSHHRVPHLGLRTSTHKLIVARETESGPPAQVELYALQDDPQELRPAEDAHAERWTPTVERLMDWIRGSAPRPASATPLSPEEEAMLVELGYVGESQ